MEKNIKKEINIAKKAAISAGNVLLKQKKDINKIMLSSKKDIKLKADIDSETITRKILGCRSFRWNCKLRKRYSNFLCIYCFS